MAGIQQPSAAQGASDGDDSVDGVSLSSGTSAQSMVASLMQSTADELKAAGGDASKLDSDSTAAGNTATTAANASAASSFQSHLGISSQLQTSASPETANTQVNTPVGASGFADEVGDKITWMAHQGVQSASLKMTPENMGPVEVKISMQDGSATVAINAAHADTRAALEQALPRLREMFSTQGLNLTDASVSQQFAQKQQPQKQSVSAVGSVGSVSDEPDSAVVSLAAARLGLLDTYA
jgi:flagellar hook-length control protein FliK